MIYPLVTGFHWADFDFQWYIEGCRSRPGPAKTASGFHSVETFINQPVHPGTDNITIPAYVAGVIAGKMPPGTTPMQVADQIDARADARCAAIAQSLEHAARRSAARVRRHARRHAAHGAARQVLRGKDSRRDRARAVSRDSGDANISDKAVEHLNARAQQLVAIHAARAGALIGIRSGPTAWACVDWKELDAEVRRRHRMIAENGAARIAFSRLNNLNEPERKRSASAQVLRIDTGSATDRHAIR